MQCRYYQKLLLWLSFIIAFIITTSEAHASHAQGADLTYQCLGGNQYQFTLSFYRDCGGVSAPNNVTINLSSASCNQNFNATLNPIPNTGQDVTPVCPSITTQCSNGNYPGVQEYIYRGIVNLPMACADWVFSFTICCRNAAITNINAPGSQNIYIEATLNNLSFPCNNSPVFSNRPIPYVCTGQNFCYNNGATDPDGDSLSFQLITPLHAPAVPVTYVTPYSASQPLASNPPVSFSATTGDICMTPTQQQVTVVAVKVTEWRGGNVVGTVMRDVQLQTMTCTNNIPYINGINGSNIYSATICAGQAYTFYTNSFDADQAQALTLTWNNGIPGATFTSTNAQFPVGTFSWTPSVNQISPIPYCFTVTVQDNNCPYNGSQTFSFCITVTGLSVSVNSTTPANCGASNGSAVATVTGGNGPYSYQWMPSGGNSAQANGLQAGTYTVYVTDGSGCMGSDTAVVQAGAANATVNITSTHVSCTGGSNGSATAVASGGQQPYTFFWPQLNASTQTVIGLPPGTYSVIVTTANGCTTSASVTITQPAPLALSSAQNDALCFGTATGSATVLPSGGTGPYSYQWSNSQTTAAVNNLAAGNYFCTVTDANNCTAVINVQINQPAQLQLSLSQVNHVTCFGGSNGTATVFATGGIAPYNFAWNTNPQQNSATGLSLSAGSYTVTVTDANNCTTTLVVVITQPQQLTAASATTLVHCYGGSNGTATANPSGGTGPYSYQWSSTPQQFTQTATGLPAGNYTVIVTDNYGCTVSTAVNVSQPPQLNAAMSNVVNVSCNGGNNGSATVMPSGGTAPYAYQWSTTPQQFTQTAANLPAGSYTVNISDMNGCATVSSVVITQPAPLVVVPSGTDTICPGQAVIISANASGGNGGYNYFWAQNLGNGQTHVVNPGSTTQYVVTATDNQGCVSAPQSVTVYVYSFTVTDVNITTPPPLCSGNSTTFTAQVTGFTGPVTYSWSHNLGSSPGPLTVSPTATTTYTLWATNGCGITVQKPVTVTVNPLPVINLSPQSATGCDEVTLVFADYNPNNSGCTYSWNFGDGGTSGGSNTSHSYTQGGIYTVTVVVTSQAGCTGTASSYVTVAVNASPVAGFNATPDPATTLEPTVYFVNTTTNAATYSWDFGDGSSSLLANPVHTYAQKGVYLVVLYTSNASGCYDTAMRVVEVEPEFSFYIPNAFTPNDDGKNDVFMGEGQEISAFEMLIFDRWGELIFRTENPLEGWDGTVRGGSEIAQQDAYVYKISLRDHRNKQHVYHGTVSLIK
ncbi:MAG: PKD domain-containing protein [Bacteroidota bacterium]